MIPASHNEILGGSCNILQQQARGAGVCDKGPEACVRHEEVNELMIVWTKRCQKVWAIEVVLLKDTSTDICFNELRQAYHTANCSGLWRLLEQSGLSGTCQHHPKRLSHGNCLNDGCGLGYG